jgi:hypothetical protein
MADKKISELTALTGANVATDDQLVIVDTSAALTKNITIDEFKNALDTATGFVRITGDTMTGDLNFGDNDKAIFGAGSDLQIYHDGSNSFIEEAGTGNLIVAGSNEVKIRPTPLGSNLAVFKSGSVDLYASGTKRLETTSTGIDVTGTVTADDHVYIEGNAARLSFGENDTTDLNTRLSLQSSSFRVETVNNSFASAVNRITVDNFTGDISFYEDTGTTAKFFWDASAESLGIGTTSPSAKLSLPASSASTYADGIFIGAGTGDLYGLGLWHNTGGNTTSYIDNRYDNAAAATKIRMRTEGTPVDAMTILGSGNVGIGTDSPSVKLHMVRNAENTLRIEDTLDSTTMDLRADSVGGFVRTNGSYPLRFLTNSAEAMRIDSSGNLYVGTTNGNPTGNHEPGTLISEFGQINVHRDGGNPLRIGSSVDGNLTEYYKQGVLVGSIASVSYGMQIYATGVNNTGWTFGDGSSVLPMKNSALSDNFVDLGSASYRMDDIYATNGTIQTSDRNEKQDIAELSDAEQRVAVAAKGLLRKFRWRDAVAEKGDEARTHFGIIAQDLQAAFAAEGLDAGDYAMFISSTWTDEETGEERTRMGVRYSELLAFIIAAI